MNILFLSNGISNKCREFDSLSEKNLSANETNAMSELNDLENDPAWIRVNMMQVKDLEKVNDATFNTMYRTLMDDSIELDDEV